MQVWPLGKENGKGGGLGRKNFRLPCSSAVQPRKQGDMEQREPAKAYCIRQAWPGSGIPTMLSHWLGDARRSRASPGRSWRRRCWSLSVSCTPWAMRLHCRHDPHSTSIYCLLQVRHYMLLDDRVAAPWFLGNHTQLQNRVVCVVSLSMNSKACPQFGGGWSRSWLHGRAWPQVGPKDWVRSG